VEKAKYYIEHDEEREAIAKAGYAEAHSKHTIDHRLSFMLDKAKEHGLIKQLVEV
jgi:spore maturation protein CgeB